MEKQSFSCSSCCLLLLKAIRGVSVRLHDFIHCFVCSSIFSFLPFIIHSSMFSRIDSATLSFIHAFIYSFIHAFFHPFVHLCFDSFVQTIQAFIHSSFSYLFVLKKEEKRRRRPKWLTGCKTTQSMSLLSVLFVLLSVCLSVCLYFYWT